MPSEENVTPLDWVMLFAFCACEYYFFKWYEFAERHPEDESPVVLYHGLSLLPFILYAYAYWGWAKLRAFRNFFKSQFNSFLRLGNFLWNAVQRFQSAAINCLPQFLLTPLMKSYEYLNRPPVCNFVNKALDYVIYGSCALVFFLTFFNSILGRDSSIYTENFLLQLAFIGLSIILFGTPTVSRIVNHVIYICLHLAYASESLEYKTRYGSSYIVLIIFILNTVWHLLDCLFGEGRFYDSQPDDGSPDDGPGGSPPEDGPPGGSPPDDGPPGGSPPDDGPPGDSPPGEGPPGDSPPGEGPPGDSPPDDSSKPLKRGQWKPSSSGKRKGKKKR